MYNEIQRQICSKKRMPRFKTNIFSMKPFRVRPFEHKVDLLILSCSRLINIRTTKLRR